MTSHIGYHEFSTVRLKRAVATLREVEHEHAEREASIARGRPRAGMSVTDTTRAVTRALVRACEEFRGIKYVDGTYGYTVDGVRVAMPFTLRIAP